VIGRRALINVRKLVVQEK